MERQEAFILEHDGEDTGKLLFASESYPGIDMKRAARIIEARKKIKEKVPEWFECTGLDYPQSLPLEQCSSQATALFKQRFVPQRGVVADITGGLGVDSWAMSQKASLLVYHERQEDLCLLALSNFSKLGCDNIIVLNRESIDDSRHYDLIYADPARRGKASQRIYSITDCEPDILTLKSYLLKLSDRLLVKISPMADISRTLELFPEATEIVVTAVNNEVKELLLYIDKQAVTSEPTITAVEIGKERCREFCFKRSEESKCEASFCNGIGKYLYRPYKAILKAGAYKILCQHFHIDKLSPSTHLYTSDESISDFPGQIFRVIGSSVWNKETAHRISTLESQAELSAVNFPVDTDTLRKKLKIKQGGSHHLFATTAGTTKIVITAERLA